MDEDSPDPILTAGLFEGDIAGVNLSDITYFEKNAIRDLSKRWPGGVIPYVISSSFSMSALSYQYSPGVTGQSHIIPKKFAETKVFVVNR